MSDRHITEIELILRIRSLSLQQRKVVSDVITELNNVPNEEPETSRDNEEATARRRTLGPNEDARLLPRQPKARFVDDAGISLSIGDRVRINNTRKHGKTGDLAEVVKFNRTYVAVEIFTNGVITQRSSNNLTFLE